MHRFTYRYNEEKNRWDVYRSEETGGVFVKWFYSEIGAFAYCKEQNGEL